MSIRHYYALRGALIGMAACCALVGGASAQEGAFHADGTTGFTVGFSNNTTIVLNVSRGGSGTTRQTFLSLSLFTFTGNSFTSTFGSGLIPNTDLTGDGTALLRLNTDTSTNPNFTITSCTFDFTTFTFTCSVISGGPISVTWAMTQGFTIHQTSMQSLRFAQFTEQFAGESDLTFAVASGTVLGNALGPDAFGQIGANHNTTITITKNR